MSKAAVQLTVGTAAPQSERRDEMIPLCGSSEALAENVSAADGRLSPVGCVCRAIISSLIAQTFIIPDTWWCNHLCAVNTLLNLRLNTMPRICVEICKQALISVALAKEALFLFLMTADVMSLFCCRLPLSSATTWTSSRHQATVQEAAQRPSTLCKQRACWPTKRKQLLISMLSKRLVYA